MNKHDYKNICPFKWFVLENFPFIEDDFDALTNWQLFCKIGKKINKIIDSQNEVGQAVEDFTEKFIALYNYVHDYFNNLDVQDEINNKLDEMVEDGTFESILLNYAKVSKIYNTTVEMLEDSEHFINDMKIKTLGYYNINDGGGAEFLITNTSNNNYQIDLENGLFAEMIIKNDTINFAQLGAKPSTSDNPFDNKQYLLKYVSICNDIGITYKLFIPAGEWFFSPVHIQRVGGVYIEGISGFQANTYKATTIKAIGNQNYIWKFGGEENMGDSVLSYSSTNTSNIIKNITFSSPDYKINYGCLVLEYANYGTYQNISFHNIIGGGLYIRSSWENFFDNISFRNIKDFSIPKLWFAAKRNINTVSANISSSSFDHFIFEAIAGNYIFFEHKSATVNNQFGEINIENGATLLDTEEGHDITDDTDLSAMRPYYMISGYMAGNVFDVINYTGNSSFSRYYNAVDGHNYYFKSLIQCGENIQSGDPDVFSNIFEDIYVRRGNVQIFEALNPMVNSFNVVFGNIIIHNQNIPNFTRFDVQNCGKLAVNYMTSRIKQDNNKLLTAIPLYKYTSSEGGLYSDSTSINNLKLVCGNVINLFNNTIMNTFPPSETKHQKYLVRVKTNSDGTYRFAVQSKKNGETTTPRIYTETDLTPNTWYDIPIYFNFDAGANVKIYNPISGMFFDTITYVGEEDIS